MIRPMEERDWPALTALWAVLGNHTTPEQLAAVYRQMEGDPAYRTFVWEKGDAPVGFVTCVRVLAAGLPHGYLKVNGLAVLPEHRGKGVGRALMEACEAWGKEQGLSVVLLNSGVKREQAHAFYRHLGYDQDSWCFDKKI